MECARPGYVADAHCRLNVGVNCSNRMSEPQARLLIRIPQSLKVRLVELAKREHRSLNRQIEFLLECGIGEEARGETSRAPHSEGGRRQRK